MNWYKKTGVAAAVSVVHPARSAPEQEIVLPSNVQAFVDIGGHVNPRQERRNLLPVMTLEL